MVCCQAVTQVLLSQRCLDIVTYPDIILMLHLRGSLCLDNQRYIWFAGAHSDLWNELGSYPAGRSQIWAVPSEVPPLISCAAKVKFDFIRFCTVTWVIWMFPHLCQQAYALQIIKAWQWSSFCLKIASRWGGGDRTSDEAWYVWQPAMFFWRFS